MHPVAAVGFGVVHGRISLGQQGGDVSTGHARFGHPDADGDAQHGVDSASALPTLPNVARKDWRNRSCNWSVPTCMATDPLAGASGMGGECVIVGAAGVPGVLG